MEAFRTKANKTLPVSHHCGMLLLGDHCITMTRRFPCDSPHSNMQLLPPFPALYTLGGRAVSPLRSLTYWWLMEVKFDFLYPVLASVCPLRDCLFWYISTPNCILKAVDFLPISLLSLTIGKGISVLLVESSEHTKWSYSCQCWDHWHLHTGRLSWGPSTCMTLWIQLGLESLQRFAQECGSYWTKWTPILCD